MATKNVKEQVEATAAVEAVNEAEKKVEQIKADKAAAKAKKHAEREAKHPKLGKVINWIDDNKVGIGVGVGIGGPLGVAGVLAYQKLKAKNTSTDEVADIPVEDESRIDTTPFD